MIYFTSDLHIGHDKPFLWGGRGFSSIEEHDTEILKRWNSVVSVDDTVYILGDLCLGGNEKEWDKIFKNLNGQKYVITGNHDTVNKIARYELDYNMTCYGLAALYKHTKKWIFYLSHYPTFTANFDDKQKHRHIINLYGHTHQSTNFFNDNPYMYHVGVDSHNFMPVSIEQIIYDISTKEEKMKEN